MHLLIPTVRGQRRKPKNLFFAKKALVAFFPRPISAFFDIHDIRLVTNVVPFFSTSDLLPDFGTTNEKDAWRETSQDLKKMMDSAGILRNLKKLRYDDANVC